MRSSGRSTLAVLLLVAATNQLAAAEQCRVSYNGNSRRPLLFGGVVESCSGFRCANRNDFYGKRCGAADGSSWGTCTSGQSQAIIDFARQSIPDGVNLSPCDLMTYLQGRTLWILGDSHTKTLWTALQCYLIDFWDHQICAPHTDDGAVNELANLPKVKGYSNCLHLLGAAGGRICIIEVVLGNYLTANSELPAGGVLPLLRQKFAQPQDIFYINFGAWHRKNNADWANFVPALEALGKDYQQNKGVWPHVLFRENAAIHPKNLEKKTCDAITGYDFQSGSGNLVASAAADGDDQMRFQIGRPLFELVNTILPKYGIPIVHTFNTTVPLYNQHIEMNHVSDLDCIHYCFPGVPQMWIWELYKAMRSGAAGIKPLKVVSSTPRWGGFGGSSLIEDDGDSGSSSPAPAPSSSSSSSASRGSSSSSSSSGGSRWFEALRLPFGRRRLQGEQSAARVMQAQRYQCVRSKVTF